MTCCALRASTLASLLLALSACPGDQGGGEGTETEGATTGTDSAGSTGDSTAEALDSSGSGGSSGESTGEPAGVALIPCDPLAEESCDQGVCAGASTSGFYCRFGCSTMAEPGTACGTDDVCLTVGIGGEGTACFDVEACDLVTGEGCDLGAGDSCVLASLEPLRTVCVPAGEAGAAQACDPAGMIDCGAGLACLGGSVTAGSDGACTSWCEPGGDLPDGCPACAPLTDGVGICAECSVLGDDCAAGTQCAPANELLGGVCVDVGAGGPGAPCQPLAGDCAEGLVCVELDDNNLCLPGCDPGDPMCSGEGESCVDLGALDPGILGGVLGVCLDVGVQLCDPTAPMCAAGQNCLDVGSGLGICGDTCDPGAGGRGCGDNFACIPSDGTDFNLAPFVEGNGACGLGCSTDAECGGGTCLRLDGIEADGLCGQTCTPGMADACAAGYGCVATPEDPMVGACMAGGTPCNPTNLGECGGAACIPQLGEALIGICLPPCFEQDPQACGGMPAMCEGKTAARWSEGTCIGGGPACALVGDSCPAGQACGIAAGTAIGGQALLCDDEGPLGVGGDCSRDADACGREVGCIDGVCRQWCDPTAPACDAGACTDVSLGFYLLPGTIGACQ